MILRICFLNLPCKPDRRVRLAAHLAELDLCPAGRMRWVKALSGNWSPGPAWWKSGNGAWGCLMSHLHVVHDAIVDGLASYLVLEDYVFFQPQVKEMLTALMQDVPARPFVLRGVNGRAKNRNEDGEMYRKPIRRGRRYRKNRTGRRAKGKLGTLRPASGFVRCYTFQNSAAS